MRISHRTNIYGLACNWIQLFDFCSSVNSRIDFSMLEFKCFGNAKVNRKKNVWWIYSMCSIVAVTIQLYEFNIFFRRSNLNSLCKWTQHTTVAILMQQNARAQRKCDLWVLIMRCYYYFSCDERLWVCTNGNEFELQLAAAHTYTLISDFPFSKRLDL